jgi:Glycosyltransferase family 87
VGRAGLSLVFCLSAALCAAWTVFAGKDVNWDLLNYHYYLPFELLAGRLDQDFFAASAQSYLNPAGYLPFYWMVSSGWHSVAASTALAVAHSTSIALLYLLAWRLFAHLPRGDRVLMSCLATAMAAATAVFWATVGSSFLDPLLVPLMLAALLLLLDASRHAVRCATLAGALFGAAAALKYSNAIFALAAFPLVLAMPGAPGAVRVRACFGYVGGGALAVGLFAGPWLVLMMREFGNPVFPLMNGWFQSPHAAFVNDISERFMPKDFVAALTFPFRMIVLDRALYAETFAPDIRLAALLVAAAALPGAALRRGAPPARALRGIDWRLLAFLGAAAVLWLASSGNGRYGMIVLLLAGLCLARVVERLLPPSGARIALALLLAVQLGTSIIAAPSRWFIAEAWSRSWLPYEVPERASQRPALYLTVEMLPMAVVAPFVHPASSFVNFRGQHSLAADSPRLAALLERHRGRVRTLGRGLELVDGKPHEDQLRAYDATLLRIGFRVDADDCFAIRWRPDDDDLVSRAANRLAGALPPHEPLSVASCGLRAAKRDPADVETERLVSSLFDRIEKGCPALFRGQTAVTEPLGSGWSRFYSGLDARLEAYADRVILNRPRAGEHIDLGALSDWARKQPPLPAACGAPREQA